MPAVVADAELLAGQVAVAVVGAATVASAVRDVAGFALPVLVALAEHAANRRRVGRAAPAVARTVVGTRVYPAGRTHEIRQGSSERVFSFIRHCARGRSVPVQSLDRPSHYNNEDVCPNFGLVLYISLVCV